MIATVSPSDDCFGETLSTLKFAQRAKKIKNNAVVNENMTGSITQLQEVIKRLRHQLSLSTSNQITHQPSSSTSNAIVPTPQPMNQLAISTMAPPSGTNSDEWISIATEERVTSLQKALECALNSIRAYKYQSRLHAEEKEAFNEHNLGRRLVIKLRDQQIHRCQYVIDGLKKNLEKSQSHIGRASISGKRRFSPSRLPKPSGLQAPMISASPARKKIAMEGTHDEVVSADVQKRSSLPASSISSLNDLRKRNSTGSYPKTYSLKNNDNNNNNNNKSGITGANGAVGPGALFQDSEENDTDSIFELSPEAEIEELKKEITILQRMNDLNPTAIHWRRVADEMDTRLMHYGEESAFDEASQKPDFFKAEKELNSELSAEMNKLLADKQALITQLDQLAAEFDDKYAQEALESDLETDMLIDENLKKTKSGRNFENGSPKRLGAPTPRYDDYSRQKAEWENKENEFEQTIESLREEITNEKMLHENALSTIKQKNEDQHHRIMELENLLTTQKMESEMDKNSLKRQLTQLESQKDKDLQSDAMLDLEEQLAQANKQKVVLTTTTGDLQLQLNDAQTSKQKLETTLANLKIELEKAKKESEKSVELGNELNKQKIELEKMKKKLTEKTNTVEDQEQRLEELSNEVSDLEKIRITLQNERDDTQAIADSATEELDTLRDEILFAKDQAAQVALQLEGAQNAAKDLKTKYEPEGEDLSAVLINTEQNGDDNQKSDAAELLSMKNEIKTVKEENQDLRNDLKRAQADCEAQVVTLKEMDDQIRKQKNEVSELSTKLEQAQAMSAQAREAEVQMEIKLASAEAIVEASSETAIDLMADLKSLEDQLEESQNKLQEATNNHDKALKDLENVQNEKSEAVKKLEELQESLKEMVKKEEAEKDDEKQEESKSINVVADIAKLETQWRKLCEEKQRLCDEKQNAKVRIEEKNKALTEKNEELRKSVKEIASAAKSAEQEVARLRAEQSSRIADSDRLKKLEQEYATKVDEVIKSKKEVNESEKRIELLEKSNSSLQGKLNAVSAEEERTHKKFEDAQVEVTRLTDINSTLEKQMKELKDNNQRLEDANAKLSGHNNQKQRIQHMAKLKQENNDLISQVEAVRQELDQTKARMNSPIGTHVEESEVEPKPSIDNKNEDGTNDGKKLQDLCQMIITAGGADVMEVIGLNEEESYMRAQEVAKNIAVELGRMKREIFKLEKQREMHD
eukprot:TRINITY_DN3864_c0_g1_i4.p1 TRINITY_DN3864_c0_g1~~TRINITY_DN3864_c0_g1_i4.p1  ORF type:complete len:1213 (-),score=522.63 TRINITY_DN3864_c0_g1_i4:212-3850(-)